MIVCIALRLKWHNICFIESHKIWPGLIGGDMSDVKNKIEQVF